MFHLQWSRAGEPTHIRILLVFNEARLQLDLSRFHSFDLLIAKNSGVTNDIRLLITLRLAPSPIVRVLSDKGSVSSYLIVKNDFARRLS